MMCKPSYESGDRRQEAATEPDQGEIDMLSRDELLRLAKEWGAKCDELERELAAVARRSADSRVLEQVIAYVEAWADQKRHDAIEQKARHVTQGSVRTLGEAKLLGRLAVAIREKFQNQIKKPGPG